MARTITLGTLTLAWHARNGQWRKSIGHKPDKAGARRVPAEFYFGAEESAAFMRAAAKIQEWDKLRAEWEELRTSAAGLFPGMPLGKPFWLTVKAEGFAQTQSNARGIVDAMPQNVTVEAARVRFLASLKARLTLMGSKGLKQSTVNTMAASLERAMVATVEGGALVIPPDTFVHHVDHGHIAAVIDFHYRKGGLAERSALNYCRAFQAFLEWMDNQPDLLFHKPKGMGGLFKLGRPAADPRVPTVAEVAAIYGACQSDAERLYVLLGINCGMYESDIAALTPAAIADPAFVWWRREKTSHQNTFHTLHWLFPETVALIAKVRAPENAHGRLLLNSQGRPIAEDRDGYRHKSISSLFPDVIERAKLKGKGLSFKALRKFGAHELRMNAKGDKDDLARKYLGQAIRGVLKNYVRDDFADLTAALKRLRTRLLKAKAFPPLPGN